MYFANYLSYNEATGKVSTFSTDNFPPKMSPTYCTKNCWFRIHLISAIFRGVFNTSSISQWCITYWTKIGKRVFYTFYVIFRIWIGYTRKKSKIAMWRKIEMKMAVKYFAVNLENDTSISIFPHIAILDFFLV